MLPLQVPAEYPLRPSLVSLAEDKPGAEVEGEAAVKEELCAMANEVSCCDFTKISPLSPPPRPRRRVVPERNIFVYLFLEETRKRGRAAFHRIE